MVPWLPFLTGSLVALATLLAVGSADPAVPVDELAGWQAASRVWLGYGDPLDCDRLRSAADASTRGCFGSPGWTLMMMLPWALPPIEVVMWPWRVLMAALFGASVTLWLRCEAEPGWRGAGAAVLATAVLWPAVLRIGHGGVEPITALAIGGAAVAVSRERFAIGGELLGLAGALRPWNWALGAIFLQAGATGRRHGIGAISVVAGLVVLVDLVLFGVVLPGPRSALGRGASPATALGWVQAVGGASGPPGAAAWWVWAGLVVTVVAAVALVARRSDPVGLVLPVCLAVLVLTPEGSPALWASAVGPLAATWSRRPRTAVGVVGAAAWWVPGGELGAWAVTAATLAAWLWTEGSTDAELEERTAIVRGRR